LGIFNRFESCFASVSRKQNCSHSLNNIEIWSLLLSTEGKELLNLCKAIFLLKEKAPNWRLNFFDLINNHFINIYNDVCKDSIELVKYAYISTK